MAICTFFGHRDAPKETETILKDVIIELIEQYNVDIFYVGDSGSFDGMVRKVLRLLKLDYPHIDYAVVLACFPIKEKYDYRDYLDTILPDGLEDVPPKYAILKRNKWMLNNADYVVTYVTRIYGGAADFKRLAEKKDKKVIEISEL